MENALKNLKVFKVKKTSKGWWLTSPGIIAAEIEERFAKKVMRALNSVIKENFTPKKKKSGSYSRRKGHTFERELVAMLKPWFPAARRQLEFQKDCALGVDLAETGRFRFQCKKLKTYASVSTIKEVQCDRELFGDVPVLVTAADGEPAMAIMHLEDFLDLLPKPAKPFKKK